MSTNFDFCSTRAALRTTDRGRLPKDGVLANDIAFDRSLWRLAGGSSCGGFANIWSSLELVCEEPGQTIGPYCIAILLGCIGEVLDRYGS